MLQVEIYEFVFSVVLEPVWLQLTLTAFWVRFQEQVQGKC
jgi:hypothetical protein